jgi:hypothetical protein
MSEKCEIHDIELQDGTMPLQYGLLLSPLEGFYEARKDLFPNSNSFALGGCVVNFDHVSEVTKFCPKCREAEKAWTGEAEMPDLFPKDK